MDHNHDNDIKMAGKPPSGETTTDELRDYVIVQRREASGLIDGLGTLRRTK